MAEVVSQIGEHVRVATVQRPGMLAPAQVSPYCSRCCVAWPCPPAAHQLKQETEES